MDSGKADRIPLLKMDMVWVPHTSMSPMCVLLAFAISASKRLAILGSRYSSMCLMGMSMVREILCLKEIPLLDPKEKQPLEEG